MDNQKLMQVLMANKDKPFVRRILDRYAYPVLNNQDGSISTHSMASGEGDGRNFAYPTVVSDNQNGLKRLSNAMAFRNAMDTQNAIEFPSAADADWFARNYKNVWNK